MTQRDPLSGLAAYTPPGSTVRRAFASAGEKRATLPRAPRDGGERRKRDAFPNIVGQAASLAPLRPWYEQQISPGDALRGRPRSVMTREPRPPGTFSIRSASTITDLSS